MSALSTCKFNDLRVFGKRYRLCSQECMGHALQNTLLPSPVISNSTLTVVLVGAFHRCTQKMIWVAEKLGHPWIAFHVRTSDLRNEISLLLNWRTHFPNKKLLVAEASNDDILPSIADFIDRRRGNAPNRYVHALTGNFSANGRPTTFYHLETARGINETLSRIPRVIVTNVAFDAAEEEL